MKSQQCDCSECSAARSITNKLEEARSWLSGRQVTRQEDPWILRSRVRAERQRAILRLNAQKGEY
jgi:hypothetical protein